MFISGTFAGCDISFYFLVDEDDSEDDDDEDEDRSDSDDEEMQIEKDARKLQKKQKLQK